MQIFIHRGKSKALDCGCGGDARTIDPPKSEAQLRAMWAASEGRSTLGIPKSVGKEFVGRDEELIREEYKGFLIRQLSGAGWDVSKNGEHYMTYGSLVSAKKGIDRLEQAMKEVAMKKKFLGGRSAG